MKMGEESSEHQLNNNRENPFIPHLAGLRILGHYNGGCLVSVPSGQSLPQLLGDERHNGREEAESGLRAHIQHTTGGGDGGSVACKRITDIQNPGHQGTSNRKILQTSNLVRS